MRATAISMAAVLILTGAVCVLSMHYITGVSSRMEGLHGQALEYAQAGEADEARRMLEEMKRLWTRQEGRLALLFLHEEIDGIGGMLIEAQCSFEGEDEAAFVCSMAHLREALERMQANERFSLSNILRLC